MPGPRIVVEFLAGRSAGVHARSGIGWDRPAQDRSPELPAGPRLCSSANCLCQVGVFHVSLPSPIFPRPSPFSSRLKEVYLVCHMLLTPATPVLVGMA